jgi:hypothetical protein
MELISMSDKEFMGGANVRRRKSRSYPSHQAFPRTDFNSNADMDLIGGAEARRLPPAGSSFRIEP